MLLYFVLEMCYRNSERNSCKVYYLRDVRQFVAWREAKINWKPSEEQAFDGERGTLSDDDLVFLHQDYTVTQSMWPGENVIFSRVTPEWRDFCNSALNFKIPNAC